MKQYIDASAMTSDENCGDGTAVKVNPSAGGTECIALPEGSCGAAFLTVPPDNWNGVVKATIYGHGIEAGPGEAMAFVAAKSIPSGAQLVSPENAEKLVVVVPFAEGDGSEYFVAVAGTLDVEGPAWTPGTMLSLWVGRLATDNTYEHEIRIVGVSLDFTCVE
jgi:hypothetical protein